MTFELPTQGWKEPTSADEAITRQDEARSTIVSINSQLEDPAKLVDGRPVSNEEYTLWRKKARTARRYAEQELSRLHRWIRNHRQLELADAQSARARRRNLEHTDSSRPDRYRANNPIELVGNFRRITGVLYALYLNVGEYLDAPSDERWEKVVYAFKRAERIVEPEAVE